MKGLYAFITKGRTPVMHTKTSVSSKRQHWLLRIMIVLALAALYMIAMASSIPVTHADGIPGGNVSDPAVRAVDIAKPAVVRILTSLGGHLTVHFSATQNVTFPQGGGVYPLTLSGSGTFISAHGDILTADHVVNPPHDQQVNQFLDTVAAPDVANYINQHLKPNPPATQGQVAQELISGQLPSDPNYDRPISQVFLSTDYTGPLSAPDLSSVPAQFQAPVDRIELESSANQEDVAIIHVNMKDMASVQLGDSSSVQQQDRLTILGFPGNGDVSDKPTNLLTLSVNQIFVSSIKTTDQGAQVIQVGGNVEHGDSGGPALNDRGSIVGIVSFGSSGQGSTSFLQASNSARGLVQSLHLDTTPGPFQRAWGQAFSDYAASIPGHWHKAQQELGQLATKYPSFKAIAPYLAYAQTQAKNEPGTEPQSTPSTSPGSQPRGNNLALYAVAIGGAILVIALAVALYAVTLRRRRQRGPALPAGIRAAQSPIPAAIPQQGQDRSAAPPQRIPSSQQDEGMAAFGAPSTSFSGAPVATAGASGGLRPWPCGHMNRPNARYCSICGEPAPPPPTISRRIEQ
jgi:serine protease Do